MEKSRNPEIILPSLISQYKCRYFLDFHVIEVANVLILSFSSALCSNFSGFRA
jgi:hypothetical protein